MRPWLCVCLHVLLLLLSSPLPAVRTGQTFITAVYLLNAPFITAAALPASTSSLLFYFSLLLCSLLYCTLLSSVLLSSTLLYAHLLDCVISRVSQEQLDAVQRERDRALEHSQRLEEELQALRTYQRSDTLLPMLPRPITHTHLLPL